MNNSFRHPFGDNSSLALEFNHISASLPTSFKSLYPRHGRANTFCQQEEKYSQ